MSPTRWQQIEDVFQAALDLAPAERAGFILETCGADDDLRREVEKLIEQYEEADRFIESPVWTDSRMFNSAAKRDLASSLEKEMPLAAINGDTVLGKRIGVFRLSKELGRGGMGAVFLAERADGEFKQKVAIKLIKRGMDTDFIVRRFRHERQILASLDHPNIARLLDGGTTDDGLPYFVMEFIEGEPLHRYCDARRLSIEKRLRLFRQICSAVAYAHEHQIIHRDIKPGNILVPASGVPKLLDFGIAKILDPDLIHESVNPTSTMMRLMTPEYASPEQVRGLPVTPESDVYALGVLLYELLTGHRPYSFHGRSPHEISRVICETAPELPSAVVAESDKLLPSYVSNNVTIEKALDMRDVSADVLQKELSGNLDNIILKALCKEPIGRYASVKEFSDDIARHLDGQEVAAEACSSASFAFEKSISDSVNTGERSVAVLPFKLLHVVAGDENTGDRFLGLGLADALITRLSNIRRFIVRPTSSVLRYGGEDQAARFDPFQAGRDLGVDFILDGHIQRAADRIRISVQLLSVVEQTTVWAERFDERFTDVLSLEDAISTQVAEALVPRLTVNEREQLQKRGTDNAEAFEAYLRGRYHWNTFTEEGFAKAIVAYNQAVAHDPNYALAFAGIADYYCWLGIYGVLPANECFQAAKEAALKAIELDPELSEAHASLGFAVLGGDYDWMRGEAACRRALDLNSHNAQAHVWYSLQLTMEGRFDDGVRHAEKGVELDPLTPFNQHHLGWSLYFARRFDEAIAQYQKSIAASPLYPMARFGAAWVLRQVGRHEDALIEFGRGQELSTDSMFMKLGQAQTLALAGREREARRLLGEIEQAAASRFVSPYHLSLVYLFLGEREKTLALLERAFKEREAWIVWMGVEPAFDALWNEPRFLRILELSSSPRYLREQAIEIEKSVTPSTKILSVTKTADNAQKDATTTEIPAPKSKNLKWIWASAAAAVLLVVVALAFTRYGWEMAWRNQRSSASSAAVPIAPTENAKSFEKINAAAIAIAVLPFTTIGAETDDDQYLGVGTADLVTNKLGAIKEINLRSASSVRRYLKTQKTPVEIGRELAVNYVVNGNVERANGRVEARLEMTDVANDNVVWTENFSEPETNLFALQDAISERIAAALSLKLTSADRQNLTKHFTENNEAQQLYLAGRYHFGKRTVEGLHQAIRLFDQAIEIDPNFALAYTGKADCYGLLNWYQEPPPLDAWARAKEAATKAVALDDRLAEAHSSLAFVKFHFERDYNASEAEFRRAINLKPNYATAHQWYAFLLAAQGRFDESVNIMRRAEELDPRSAVIALAVANALFYARRYDEAIAQCQRALSIDPGSTGAYAVLRWNYEKKGMAAEALETYEKEVAVAGDTPTSRAKRAHVFAAIGRHEEARRTLDELIKNGQVEHVTPYEIALIYSLLNDRDKGIEWLKKAKVGHAVGFSFIRVDPLFDNLRQDPRFAEIVK